MPLIKNAKLGVILKTAPPTKKACWDHSHSDLQMPYVGIFSIKISKNPQLPELVNPKIYNCATVPSQIWWYCSTIPNLKYYFLFQIFALSLSSMSLLSLLLSLSLITSLFSSQWWVFSGMGQVTVWVVGRQRELSCGYCSMSWVVGLATWTWVMARSCVARWVVAS